MLCGKARLVHSTNCCGRPQTECAKRDDNRLVKKTLRWIAVVIAVLGALFSLPVLARGLYFLWGWVRVHTSHSPYFQWSYLTTGLICVFVASLGVALATRAIRRKDFYIVASMASLLVGLASEVVLPNVGPEVDMPGASERILGHADHSLSDWDEAHGRFPSSEGELREALARRPLQELPIYFRQGRPVPYDVRILTNATSAFRGLPPPNPGTIVYAVSADYKVYWLTITTLKSPLGGGVTWEHLFDPQSVWVMRRKHHNPGEGNAFIE